MSLKLTPRKEGQSPRPDRDYELPPEGNHVAILYAIYEAGTQWHYRESPGNQWYEEVLISFELSDLLMDDGRPMTITKKYRKSLYESAILYKDLKAWLGNEIDFGAEFDITSILGRPCQVNIAYSDPDDNGNVYANVMSISALNARILANPPEQHNPSFIYEIEDGPPPLTIPEFIFNRINLCREFAGDRAMIERPADPKNARPATVPKTGKNLFAWCKKMEETGVGKGVIAFVNEIGKAEGWPKRMVDWDGEMIDYAYNAAVAEFVQTAPIPASNGRPTVKPHQTAMERFRERQSANGMPAPTTARRTPIDPSIDHDRPKDGKAFVAWMREMNARHDINVGKYIQGWGDLQEYPKVVGLWTETQVGHGYAEAVRKLRSINPSADLRVVTPKIGRTPNPPTTDHAPVEPDEPTNVNVESAYVPAPITSEDDDIPF